MGCLSTMHRLPESLKQLPLGLQLRESSSFEYFLIGNANHAAVEAVYASAVATGPRRLWLWGPAGVGKTHLLNAACHVAASQGEPVAYLPLSQWEDVSWELLQGLDELPLVCIDDFAYPQTMTNPPGDRWAVLGHLDRLGQRLIIASRSTLADAAAEAPQHRDVLDRYTAASLSALNREELIRAVRLRGEQRGITLSVDAAYYLITRLGVNLKQLMNALETLDQASLAAQRRVSLDFVERTFPEPPPPEDD